MGLPWRYSVAFGLIVFVLMRWAAPAILAKNPFLVALAQASRSLSWVPLVLFGFTGLFSYAKANAKPVDHLDRVVSVPASPEPWPRHADRRLDSQAFAGAGVPGFGHDSVRKTEWTVEGLRELEWKRFELLCADYYDAVGFSTQTLRCGADGGIDVKLFKDDPCSPLAVVQCKAWNTRPVGVKEVRELLGVMAHEKVRRGVFITTSSFTKDALSFAAANPIQLLDGKGFVAKLRQLHPPRQADLLESAFAGDYRTPTCPSCGVKLVAKRGRASSFWGCVNFPKCRTRLHTKS